MAGFPIEGDLILKPDGSGFVQPVTLAERVRSRIYVGLHTWLGTWRYDRRKGIRYLADVFRKGAPIQLIQQIFTEFLLSEPDVIRVDKILLNFEPVSRILSVDYTVALSDGSKLVSTVQVSL
jgi:hypothetical protein